MWPLPHFVDSNRIFDSQSLRTSYFLVNLLKAVKIYSVEQNKNRKNWIKVYFLNRFLPCDFTDVLRYLVNNVLDSVFWTQLSWLGFNLSKNIFFLNLTKNLNLKIEVEIRKETRFSDSWALLAYGKSCTTK